ncbi:CubicO group peptidase, beta-lactamase class C family [Flavobacteriaceae bacterium MAR_2010_188]|nr:CubicO group peptidase, beta-lactamase class C family [Flavobacteriaceae bacterium MAR_2010_188]
MKNFCVLIFLLFFYSASPQTDKRLKGLEQELTEILKVTKAPGFAVAIVEGERIIYSKGFGYSDYENKVLADANTLYAIGSCSKAFTSGLLGLLQKEDKISLDDNPRKYLKNLEFSSNDLNDNLIIKDLMSHRTGLPRHDYSWYLFPTTDVDSMMMRIKYQEPFTGIRQQWYYNNFMFLVQGALTEEITGKSWQDNVKEKFFDPLGMNRSNSTIEEMKQSKNAAIGYGLNKDEKIKKLDYYNISSMSPAGSINSSVNDMARWVVTWLNKGKFNGKEILPEIYVQDAMSSHSIVDAGLPDEEFPFMFFHNYGYGWFLSSYRGHYRVEHGGNIDGFSANTSFYPTEKIGIIVLTNQDVSALPSLVRNTISDRFLETEKTNWAERYNKRKSEQEDAKKEAKVSNTSSRIENTKPSHIIHDYTGIYENPGYGKFNIKVENDSLYAIFKLKKLCLKHYHYDVFQPLEVTEDGIEASDDVGLLFNFSTNDTGDISGLRMKIEPTLDGIEFNRSPITIDVDTYLLEKYVGDYQLMDTPIKVYLKDENKLFLFVPGQPEYELLPTAKHKFSFKALEGFKVEFVESTAGLFDKINLFQPNGTFQANRKME